MTAVMIGATGLVGSQLLSQLLADQRFTRVVTLGRKKTGQVHSKLQEHVVNFDEVEAWTAVVRGDVAFSCLGTTMKQAGSQAAQRKVDHDYQLAFARAAADNGVPSFVLVSAASADTNARMFYNRIKGELDREVLLLAFERTRIMRPSLLGGNRQNARAGEKISAVMLGAVNALGIARKYREIPAAVVARAMINAACDPSKGARIFTLDEIFAQATDSPR
ncbi:MAG: NAD(P)H-binding protein [Myxococcales bacterium]